MQSPSMELVINLPKSTPEVILRIDALQYKVGLIPILKNIHFDVRSGEIVALLGPNGAGKSTLLKCIAGLLPYQGTCELFNSTKREPHLRKKLGYLGHETFLYLKMSARENLNFFANLYQCRIDPDHLLKQFFLHDAADQLVETFSRGMKQRLALARAMLSSPQLLLLDEPFTGLDIEASRLLENVIASCRGSAAILMTTHELSRAFELCDSFLILKNGRQSFYGPKQSIQGGIEEFYRSQIV